MPDRRDSGWIGLGAACILVVHLLVAGFAGAAAAGQGAPAICSAAGSTSLPHPDQTSRNHGVGDCCLAGCPMVVGKAGPPPAVIVLLPEAGHRPVPPAPRHGNEVGHERSPLHARGPPAAA